MIIKKVKKKLKKEDKYSFLFQKKRVYGKL